MKKIGKIFYKVLAGLAILIMIWAVAQKASDNKLSIGGVKIFTVITGSMIPVYNIGDIIIVKEIPAEELKVDDDIVYKGKKGTFKNKIVTHRVISIDKEDDGNYKIITKGVANTGRDPEIDQTQVLGKVIGKIPIINWILRVITNIYVWMLIPVVILVKNNIKKIKNMEKE